jgi:hypothetical protein
MSWDNTSRAFTIKCNGQEYPADNLSGESLISKIQEIRREHGFEKFDVVDSTSAVISPAGVRNGEFNGDLLLVRFNKAA